MGSRYLNGLTDDQRRELEKKLHAGQHGNCFICEKLIEISNFTLMPSTSTTLSL